MSQNMGKVQRGVLQPLTTAGRRERYAVGAHPLRAPHRRDLVRRAAPLPALLPLALALSPAPRAVPFPATPSLLLPHIGLTRPPFAAWVACVPPSRDLLPCRGTWGSRVRMRRLPLLPLPGWARCLPMSTHIVCLTHQRCLAAVEDVAIFQITLWSSLFLLITTCFAAW